MTSKATSHPIIDSTSADKFARHALLVIMNIKTWSGVLSDPRISVKVRDLYNANSLYDIKDIGHYRKVLIERQALKKVKAISNMLRNFHYESTLPWKGGQRVLPVKNFYAYEHTTNTLILKREDAISEFLSIYPDAVNNARGRLGDMFNDDDYPDVDTLREKMSVEIEFQPVPRQGHFVVDGMIEQTRSEIQKNINRDIEKHVVEAIKDIGTRLKNATDTVVERLTDNDDGSAKTFRNALLNNLLALAEAIPNLNITDNPVLAEASEKIIDTMADIVPDELRKRSRHFSNTKKERVRNNMADINEMMSGYFNDPQESENDEDV